MTLSNKKPCPWYKDKSLIFIAGVFVIAAILMVVRQEQNKASEISLGHEQALLIGQNKTLVIVNQTATQDDIKQLLSSINATISNPNRTINTKSG